MTSAPAPGGPSWQDEPAASSPAGRPASSSFFQWIRGLDITRTPDRWVGGVAGAVSLRTGLDLALVRGLIVILAVFGGIGVLLYGLAWALLPEPDGRIHVEEAGRGSWTSGLTGAAALVVMGLWRPNLPFLGDGGAGGLLWSLFWIGAVVLFVYWIVNRPRGRARTATADDRPLHPTGARASTPPGDATEPTASTSPPAGSAAGTAYAPDGTSDEPSTTRAGSDDGTGDTVPLSTQADTLPYPLPYQPGRTAWSGADYPAPEYPAPVFSGPVAGPPRKAAPCRPARPSGSATALLIGGAVTIAALLFALDYLDILALSDPAVVALSAAAIVLALGIIALGMRGRTSGMVGLSAALATIAALVASLGVVGGTWIVAQDNTSTPTSVRVASEGYSVLAAETTIDLTALPPLSNDAVVPVSALVSDVTVRVPADVPVQVRTRMALGTADADGTTRNDGGAAPGDGGVLLLGTDDLNSDATGPALILDVRAALSDVTITEGATGTPARNDGTTPTGAAP
jgi:phage shock protein PspC (stress-responsive transcriptional regulator)